jgi:hypothetical protein
MIGELVVRQLVHLDEARVAEHRFHPLSVRVVLCRRGNPAKLRSGPASVSVMFGVCTIVFRQNRRPGDAERVSNVAK